jgi:hypothetical protein
MGGCPGRVERLGVIGPAAASQPEQANSASGGSVTVDCSVVTGGGVITGGGPPEGLGGRN